MWKDILRNTITLRDIVAITYGRSIKVGMIKDYIIDFNNKHPVIVFFKADGTLENQEYTHTGEMLLYNSAPQSYINTRNKIK